MTRATHCKRGHEMTPENTRWDMRHSGGQCRACLQESKRRYDRRRRYNRCPACGGQKSRTAARCHGCEVERRRAERAGATIRP